MKLSMKKSEKRGHPLKGPINKKILLHRNRPLPRQLNENVTLYLFSFIFKSPYILPRCLSVRCLSLLKISPRYIQFSGVDFVHQDSRYLQLPAKERLTLLYSLEIINGTPLDFIQVTINFNTIELFKKGDLKGRH